MRLAWTATAQQVGGFFSSNQQFMSNSAIFSIKIGLTGRLAESRQRRSVYQTYRPPEVILECFCTTILIIARGFQIENY
jgi:hypothetical protein